MKSPLWVRRLVAVLLLGALPGLVSTSGAVIEFVATDLPDTTVGEDLWRYDYNVSGRTFLQSEFFDIYFDPLIYGTLTAGPSPNADWNVIVLQQPNPMNFPPFDTGIFDSFALVNGPSLTGTFSVAFIYLGSGTPGVQPFDIFDANSNLLESGFTRRPVGEPEIPEPSTISSFLLGLTATVLKFHRSLKIRREVIRPNKYI